MEDAKDLRAAGLKYMVEGDGGNKSEVVEQMPKPDAMVPENWSYCCMYKPEKQQTVQMPDLSANHIRGDRGNEPCQPQY